MPSDPPASAGAILEIDLDAVVANWRGLAARLAPGTRCAAVVKADAYGLGAARVAPALAAAGCDLFFVATLDEGLALRRVLPETAIAVLNGLLPGTADEFAAARLMPVLNDLGQVDAWRGFARRSPPHSPGISRRAPPSPRRGEGASDGSPGAILHIDTGMSRLGLPPYELAALTADTARLEGFPLAAVMSHLACADEPAHAANAPQLAAFRRARAALPPAPASLAASSGIFLGPAYHFDIVRPGVALYGGNPCPGTPNPMAQVVRLKGRILQVRDVDRDQAVGYGAAHRMARPGRVATVSVGYADGWLRSASHRGTVGIAGQRAPVIGRISMDLMTLDVTAVDPERVVPGSLVDLLDSTYGIEAAAAAAGTIGYEILTSLGRRYARVYRGGTG